MDARANAARNGVPNAEWVCGKAEDVLAGILAAATAAPVMNPNLNPTGQPARPACAAQGDACADGAGAAAAATAPLSDPAAVAQRDPGAAAAAAGGNAAAPHEAGSAGQAPTAAKGASALGQEAGAGASAGLGQGGADAGAALVAVVDPPRAGLHPRVLRSLLQCAALHRLVYVCAYSFHAAFPEPSLLPTACR